MKIVHQISFNDTEDGPRCRFLREQRIAVAFTSLPAPPTCTDPKGLVTVSVEEADPAWPLLRDRIEDWRVVDSVTTLFTDEDRAGARYFSLEPEWQHGYPMPDSDHDWLEATYDCTARCRTCGAGAVQKAPFRLTGEPRWGRRGNFRIAGCSKRAGRRSPRPRVFTIEQFHFRRGSGPGRRTNELHEPFHIRWAMEPSMNHVRPAGLRSGFLGHDFPVAPDIHRRAVHMRDPTGSPRRSPQRSADRFYEKLRCLQRATRCRQFAGRAFSRSLLHSDRSSNFGHRPEYSGVPLHWYGRSSASRDGDEPRLRDRRSS